MELFVFDDEYVRRLREGDRETAAHFHAYFRDLLLLKLRRRLRTLEAIDEVRQEVFARCIAHLVVRGVEGDWRPFLEFLGGTLPPGRQG